jgi:hypothetical protein
MMARKRTILACSSGKLSQAEEKGDQWQVQPRLNHLHVTCLAQDARQPNRALAGTDRDGIWLSRDYGDNWEPLGLTTERIRSLAISPHDPGTIYVGTKPAFMFKSRDGGKSWQELEGFRRIPNRWWWFSPAEPPERAAYVMRIALSPQDPDCLLAGIEFGAVVLSTDGGLTWSRHRRGSLRDCHSLSFHQRDASYVYEAGGGGLSMSQDGGHSWQKQNRGVAKRYGITCAADPEDPQIWYGCVGSSPGNAFGSDPSVYLYRRHGNDWQPIGWQPHPLNETPTVLLTVPGEAGHLYAGLQRGSVMHSSDYGETWRRLPLNLEGIWLHMLVLPE